MKARKLQQEAVTPQSDDAPVSRFTGKEEDVEVGLQYFGKRYLSPYLGRWISADPLAVHAPGKADLNLYAYVSGRVLKNVDPLGLASSDPKTAADGHKVGAEAEGARLGHELAVEAMLHDERVQEIGRQRAEATAWGTPEGRAQLNKIFDQALDGENQRFTSAVARLEEQHVHPFLRGEDWAAFAKGMKTGERDAFIERLGREAAKEVVTQLAFIGAGIALRLAVRSLEAIELASAARSSSRTTEAMEAGSTLRCPCFTGETQVRLTDGYAPISSVELGDRVLPDLDVCHGRLERTYARVTLATNPEDDQGPGTFELLRTQDWVLDNNAKRGRPLYVDLPEVGATGWATVTDVTPAESPSDGPGCLVTGVFRHEAADLVQVSLSDGSSIDATANHLFYSLEHGWTEAALLNSGERLLTGDGLARVVRVDRHRGPSRNVFNLEVAGSHVYYVGDAQVLVHNACTCGFHGATGDNILGILNKGGFIPNKQGKVFLSANAGDTFVHGTDQARGMSFSIEVSVTPPANATVTRQVLPGNPQSIVIGSSSIVPADVTRMFVRTMVDGEPVFQTIEGADAIRAFLTHN